MSFLKNLIPSWLLKLIRPLYHGLVAILASFYFGQPSEKMIIIGITGTVGKSTTVAMLAHILNYCGRKCGSITTINFFDGNRDSINKHGLSMPGGWLLQKQLRQMLDNGCSYAIVECTSEGLAQNRHLAINFDVALFTNLSEAHLETHGSFGNYQTAKGQLFLALQRGKNKIFFPKKIIGVNLDDPMSGYFLSFPSAKKFGVTFRGVRSPFTQQTFVCKFLTGGPPWEFTVQDTVFSLDVLGDFNVNNAGVANACANILGIDLISAAEAMKNFHGVRGRMESVPNNFGFKVIVDYGCEPASFEAALKAAADLPHKSLIHVFGSTGGHRDAAKRFFFGRTSAALADVIIITNDDVYDSDSEIIAKNIIFGIKQSSRYQLSAISYQRILDRRTAIAKALSLAKKDDLVLITGKGSEQFLVLPGNKRIDWDEVAVVKEELKKIRASS